MKSKKFSTWFLVVAWIIYFALKKNTYAGILLMLAGAYALCEVILEIWRYMKNAKR